MTALLRVPEPRGLQYPEQSMPLGLGCIRANEPQPNVGEPSCAASDVDDELHTLDARHDAWMREQYLRDVAAVGHGECFFGAMGNAARARMGGNAA